MEKIRLGRTGLMVSRSGFGAIPIQRLDKNDSGRLLRRAYESGINFFDTSRSYTDSEEKIGLALADVRPLPRAVPLRAGHAVPVEDDARGLRGISGKAVAGLGILRNA